MSTSLIPVTIATDNEEPWELLPGEPELWFDRFETFRRTPAPNRTIREAIRRHISSLQGDEEAEKAVQNQQMRQTWARQARLWQWEKRAVAWDNRLRAIARAEEEEEFQRRHKIHKSTLADAMTIVQDRVKTLDPNALTPRETIDWMKNIIRLEHIVFGRAETIEEKNTTTRVEIHSVQVSPTLTPADPDVIDAIVEDLGDEDEDASGVDAGSASLTDNHEATT